ncbi:hypothetical protein A1O1_04785 [Capronia coronata CBS 617.96]|uniref:Methyltransferase domain-containing protein n=1 Tax=Capronia coronata CBS 617.96 TaxID=1182541 RepID=W9Y5T1_9EURO|nr:uncharacterized protein A1O1_04785 [Capronia coronata CBS 617.96]EXJ87858.1 hypothetical protein A1O1_04785 [Capronia coronata CBS 617.96]
MSTQPSLAAAAAASSSSSQPTTSTRIELYQPTLKTVPAAISALLAEYSGIPPEAQKAHITAVRDRAYATHPYPCLGRWRFLELDLASHPLYHGEILAALAKRRLQPETKAHVVVDVTDTDNNNINDWIFLDLGCCLGQDLRKLIYDGADIRRLYGADLTPAFVEIGYALFRDEDRFPRAQHFITPADVFDFSEDSELSRRCDGRVGILHCCAVFHLFGLELQKVVARRCLKLVDRGKKEATEKKTEEKPTTTTTTTTTTTSTSTSSGISDKRVLICGAQTANVRAGEYPRGRAGADGQVRYRFRHNEQSWREMWEGVIGQDEGWRERIVKIDVHAVLEERMFGDETQASSTGDGTGTGSGSGTGADSGMRAVPPPGKESEMINSQRQIGSVEEGFRWMKWWVWIEFA